MEERKTNPFNITFGEEPSSLINRNNEYSEIVSLFESESPESKVKVIIGPRGCGKTVLMTKIGDYFRDKDNWILVDLTQYSNMLEQLAGRIYENGKVKRLFLKAEFDFSFHGFSFSIKGENPISNVESLLDRIFTYLKKKDVRVLITIDDVSSNDYVKQFVQSYQGFLKNKYQVYLLMTGVFENISHLQRANNLTFFLRAPKVKLSKLSLKAISLTYARYLDLNDKEATELAKLTNGYAYAFQLIGNLLYKNGKKKLEQDDLDAIDLELEGNVYSFIWESMSDMDERIAFAMLKSTIVKDILQELGMNNSKFQVYRNRLINSGVADGSNRGSLSFDLPRFKEFVEFQRNLLDS